MRMSKCIALVMSITSLALWAGCADDTGNGQPITGDADATSDMEEDSTVTPDVTPDTEPEVEPDVVPDAEPDVVPDTEPDAEPDVMPDATPDVTPDTAPFQTCETDSDCDDGIACTTDACVDTDDGDRVCAWSVDAGSCLVNNVCRGDGEAKAGNPCVVCDADADPLGWTTVADDTACDDGDACTTGDACTAGTCSGAAKDCDDGDPCSIDACDPATGECSSSVDTGGACDDGDPCTENDSCAGGTGECVGEAVVCDDGDVCTDDSCNAETGECEYVFNTAPCELDDDLCTVDVCSEGACVAEGPLDCDDGNQCTKDTCDPDVGCVTLPTQSPCCTGQTSICDDNDPCTDDLCNPDTADCSYEFNTAPCDDGAVCTDNDACDGAGACLGAPLDCDDGNPCTNDTCSNSAGGCLHTPASDVPCDDGLDCSTGDMCQDGQCVADTSQCVCTPEFGDVANKVTGLVLGDGGHPGEGLDLDGDPSTCAPSTDCSAGINNALGVIGAFVNDSIEGAVTDGDLKLVVEHKDFPGGDGTYTISLYQGELDPANASCDFQTQVCDYLVSPSLIDPDTCEPLVKLPATLSGTSLTGGGAGVNFPFDIPFGGGASLAITLYNVQLEATVTIAGGVITDFTGVLGGAVPKEDLVTAIEGLPDDALPLPKDQILPLLDVLVENDIDTDGDGTGDAASIGIKLTGIGANITGVQP